MTEIIEMAHEEYAKRESNAYVDMNFNSMKIRYYFGNNQHYWLIADSGIERKFSVDELEALVGDFLKEKIIEDSCNDQTNTEQSLDAFICFLKSTKILPTRFFNDKHEIDKTYAAWDDLKSLFLSSLPHEPQGKIVDYDEKDFDNIIRYSIPIKTGPGPDNVSTPGDIAETNELESLRSMVEEVQWIIKDSKRKRRNVKALTLIDVEEDPETTLYKINKVVNPDE